MVNKMNEQNTVRTNLSYEDLEASFYRHILQSSFANYIQSHPENIFRGKLSGSSFFFYYHTAYVNNPFTTLIRGRVTAGSDGCVVTWHYSKNYATMAYYGFVMLVLFALYISFIVFYGGGSFGYILLILLALASVIPLSYKSREAKARLRKKLIEILKEPDQKDESSAGGEGRVATR